MKLLQIVMLLVLSTALGLSVFFTADVRGQNASGSVAANGFGNQTSGIIDQMSQSNAPEAPTGFDNQTNNFVDQMTHDGDRGAFDQVELLGDGLGPVYNAQSCRECHQNPVSGAISQVRELRAGHLENGHFVGATVVLHDEQGNPVTIANRSLINLRATCPGVDLTVKLGNGTSAPFNFPNSQGQESVSPSENIRTLRTSLNILGDGFVEAIDDNTLVQMAKSQCRKTHGAVCGQAILVPVAESKTGAKAIGRFGWKDQAATLLTFSGDAYLNEMGITNRLFPNEVTPPGFCDVVPDPEDKGPVGDQDIDHFARFMRASKAPPRDTILAGTADAVAGERLFHQIGCADCHVSAIVTAPPGTVLGGGELKVDPAVGNMKIHPFSDFLLHNVGTGDGIVQNGPQDTAHKLRTAPLWGVRMRPELMHDGLSLTFADAILRHGGEAAEVTENFRNLTPVQKRELITFLKSL